MCFEDGRTLGIFACKLTELQSKTDGFRSVSCISGVLTRLSGLLTVLTSVVDVQTVH